MATTTLQAGTLRAGARISFTERESYESGFKRIFDKEIAARLAALETERERLKRDRTVKVTLAAILVAVLMGAAIWTLNGLVIGIAGVASLFGAIFLVGSPTEKYRTRLRELVMPPVTRFLGISYDRKVPAQFNVGAFVERGVVGRHQTHRSRLQDHVSGTHDERRYAMIEALLQRKSGKNTITVFRGVLMSIDWPAAGQAEVLIGRDWGKLFNKLAGFGKADRVTLDHEEFERKFEVYATDVLTARRLLTRPFLDSMLAIADGRKGQTPTAAFTQGRLLLAIPLQQDLFEPGSLSRSLASFEEDMHALLRQLTMPRRVVDVLHGKRQPIL